MVRKPRIPALALLLIPLALGACQKKKEVVPGAMETILQSEPNQRARALRTEFAELLRSGQLDVAAAKVGRFSKVVGDILAAMDTIHHRKTAVPDFDVIRYVEALRDLGENLRGFQRLYAKGSQESLKREMLQGLLDQLRLKIR
jgi:hypothetical protein